MDSPEVLVAVSNPDHVEQLVRSASDLARVVDGGVRIVSVVVKSHDSPFGVFSDETIIEEYSGDRQALLDRASGVVPDDVPVDAEIVVARSAEDGLIRAVAELGPTALVVGWHGERRRSDVVLGSSVDAVLRRAACDVYVERIGRIADGVDAVLLPVAGGPHVRPAAAMAKAVAAANDASVTVVAVATPDDGDAAEWAAGGVAAVDAAPGPSVEATPSVRESDDPAEALTAAAEEHDLAVFGATRRGTLQARLVGSIPREVAERTGRTVLIARASEAARTGLRGLIAGFRRR